MVSNKRKEIIGEQPTLGILTRFRLIFGKLLIYGWTVTGVLLWYSMFTLLGTTEQEITDTIIVIPAQIGILSGLVLLPLSICYVLYRSIRALVVFLRTKL